MFVCPTFEYARLRFYGCCDPCFCNELKIHFSFAVRMDLKYSWIFYQGQNIRKIRLLTWTLFIGLFNK